MRHHAAVPALLVVVACGAGGPKVTLRYHPPAGAVYHFGLEQHTGLSAESGPLARMGKRNMLMRVYFTQTVKGPTSGGTEIEVLFESVTMEMPGVPASVTGGALARLQGMRATAVIDEQGKVTRSEFVNAPPGLSPDVTKRITGGMRFDLRHVGLEVTGGYVFDRFYFEGERYSERNENRFNVHSGTFVAARLGFRW